jgi:hypothetical protein
MLQLTCSFGTRDGKDVDLTNMPGSLLLLQAAHQATSTDMQGGCLPVYLIASYRCMRQPLHLLACILVSSTASLSKMAMPVAALHAALPFCLQPPTGSVVMHTKLHQVTGVAYSQLENCMSWSLELVS